MRIFPWVIAVPIFVQSYLLATYYNGNFPEFCDDVVLHMWIWIIMDLALQGIAYHCFKVFPDCNEAVYVLSLVFISMEHISTTLLVVKNLHVLWGNNVVAVWFVFVILKCFVYIVFFSWTVARLGISDIVYNEEKKQKVINLPVNTYYNVIDLVDGIVTENTCSICLMDLENGDKIKTTSCSHFFCVTCIDRWTENHTTCPTCRRKIE